MQLVLQQIMHCPYQGAMKRLYLESKVMELIALRLGQFLEASGGQKRSPSLRADDVERIYRAKEILLQNLTDPPSLATLARRVALNEHKLKVGFRELFDTTVFGYLHTQRMERAKQLLEAGSMTIIAIAQTVGYATAVILQRRFATGLGPILWRIWELVHARGVCQLRSEI